MFGGFMDGLKTMALPVLFVLPTTGSLLRVWLANRNPSNSTNSANEDPQSDVGRDILPLMPRNASERFWTAILSINAGLSEELCFRVAIPMLLLIVSGSAWIAIVVSTLLFGLAHFYQGWLGVIATTFIGAILYWVYLATGSIWITILLHALLDLNDLAIAPWFEEWLKARDSARAQA